MKFNKQTTGTRIRTFFAWIPECVENNGNRECRWLEKVTIEEEYVDDNGFVNEDLGISNGYWVTKKFV